MRQGQEIRRALGACWKRPAYYYHLLPGGHIAALKSHLCHRNFHHLDIENFFGSINKTRVTRCLKGIVGYKQARAWAIESTVRNPADGRHYFLPYGFVQSQLLASVCLRDSALGRYLHRLQRSSSFAVGVYVDDIIVSTDNADLSAVSVDLKRAAERSAFRFNAEKEEGPANKVEAFNVCLSHRDLAITTARLERFVEAINSSETSPESRNAIIAYIRSVSELQASAI